MGGRGSGSGRGKSKTGVSYFGETERAVQLRLNVEDYDLEQTKSRVVWVPKTQLSSEGKPSEWITDKKAQEFYSTRRATSQYSATWEDANGKKFSAQKSASELARQSRFESGQKSYNALIAQAKAAGVKGVRVGMKRKTIEKKMREAGIKQ